MINAKAFSKTKPLIRDFSILTLFLSFSQILDLLSEINVVRMCNLLDSESLRKLEDWENNIMMRLLDIGTLS